MFFKEKKCIKYVILLNSLLILVVENIFTAVRTPTGKITAFRFYRAFFYLSKLEDFIKTFILGVDFT